MHRGLKCSGYRDRSDFVTPGAAEPLNLYRDIRELKPTVVHFSGHGGLRAAEESPRRREVIAEITSSGGDPRGLYFRGAVRSSCRPIAVAPSLWHVVNPRPAAYSLARWQVPSTPRCALSCSSPQATSETGVVQARHNWHVGSWTMDEAHTTPDRLLDRMSKLLPGQFEELLLLANIPPQYLPGHSASPMERVAVAYRYVEQQRQLGRLAELLDTISAERELGPRDSSPLLPGPVPVYVSDEVRALSERLENARARKHTLCEAGLETRDIDQEILALRRQLREGGQLRAGDALSDGRYLLIEKLGRGGFAVVWRAYDRKEQQHVAVKILHAHLAGDPQRRERFFRGARVMMELAHPAVVRVYDPHGEEEAFCYFVMELVLGGNLRDAVLNRRVEPSRTLPLILQVGEALAEAHKRQLVHRDVKPQNIVLDEHGDAKLTDFDLVGAQDTTGGTRTGALGTFFYAAPECLDKPQQATTRADVFGLGMTAIFCLSGHDITMDTFWDRNATIAKLDCSAPVRRLLRQAVEREAEQRFANAAAMVDSLRRALDCPTWAVASGRDQYGLWAAIEVEGVHQHMRWIPPGTFLMGSPETELGRWDDEGPQHEVTLTRGYWLGETPVTQALWVAVMGENPSYFVSDDRPVERVSWDDCQTFLERLNGHVPALVARLPTEAEWERACRAGSTCATWVGELSEEEVASELDAIAWCGSNSEFATHPVRGKAPNPYGLHDMLGNVWEWCAEGVRQYKAVPVANPIGETLCSSRVSRGGAWLSHARFVRAAARFELPRVFRYGCLGFRLAGGQD
jgi:formylglycine-generating enzyme required for sulfatase activity